MQYNPENFDIYFASEYGGFTDAGTGRGGSRGGRGGSRYDVHQHRLF